MNIRLRISVAVAAAVTLVAVLRAGRARADTPSAQDLLAKASHAFQAMPAYQVRGVKVLDVAQGDKTQHAESPVLLARTADGDEVLRMTGQVFPGCVLTRRDSSWVYVGQLGQYSVRTRAAADSSGGIELMVRNLLTNVREEVGDPAKNSTGAAYVRAETLTVSGASRPCHLVEVQYAGGPDSERVEMSPKRVWLDSATGLVVRSQMHRTINGGSPGSMIEVLETTTFETPDASSPPPDSLFAFSVPAGTRRTSDITPDRPRPGNDLEGKPAPEIALKDIRGVAHKLSAMRGKVVLLDFWATWCGPCRMEMPSIQKLATNYSGRGLTVWAVNLAEDPEKVKGFLAANKYSLGVLMDDQQQAARLYRASAIPTVVVIDPAGNIAAYFQGVQNEETLMAALRKAGLK